MALPPPIALPSIAFDEPIIGDAARNVPILVVNENGSISSEKAYLIEETSDPRQCYQRWPKPPVELGDRGEVFYCQVLLRHRIENDVRVLFRRSETTVVIKELRRQAIDPPPQGQAQGDPEVNEDPYTEIAVMQQFGDQVHIMTCYEALRDARYLYIVTLYAPDGDLRAQVHRGLGGGYLPRDQVPTIVKQLIGNLEYLQLHNLVHRDLKPENTLHHPPWVPFIDFAMTRRLTVIEDRPQLLLNVTPAGTPCYVSPEVYREQPFGFPADVWALGCISWYLLTGLTLYDLPIGTDRCFQFFIQAGGIANEGLCQIVLDHLWAQNVRADMLPLFTRLQAIQDLTPLQRDFLNRLLRENPNERPSLQEILNHRFVP